MRFTRRGPDGQGAGDWIATLNLCINVTLATNKMAVRIKKYRVLKQNKLSDHKYIEF